MSVIVAQAPVLPLPEMSVSPSVGERLTSGDFYRAAQLANLTGRPALAVELICVGAGIDAGRL